jgi:hypothetical protein
MEFCLLAPARLHVHSTAALPFVMRHQHCRSSPRALHQPTSLGTAQSREPPKRFTCSQWRSPSLPFALIVFLRQYRPKVNYNPATDWSLSWAKWIQSTPSHPVFLRPILILFSLPSVSWFSKFPTVLFPSRFSNQNFVSIYHLFHACFMLCQSHPPWSDYLKNVL